MGLFSRKPSIFGLDIGSSAVKLVELAEGKGGFELVNFGISELPPEAIVDGALIDATTVIEPGQNTRLDPHGNLIITVLDHHGPGANTR